MLVEKAAGALVLSPQKNHAAMQEVIIGIDIAKDTLEVAVLGAGDGTRLQQASYPNTKHGHRQFVEAALRYDEAHLVMEATGTYHLKLSRALQEAGLRQSIVNPLQIKRFAQMKLRRVKTDKSDALLIAQYGREQDPAEATPSPAAQAQLKQIARLIEGLTKQRTALKNQQHATEQLPESAGICEQVIEEQLRALDKHLEALRAEQERLASEHFTHVKELIGSVTGIGPRTTGALLAYVGDLSSFTSHKQLTAFMGLNPVVQQSGRLEKKAHISKQGHKTLRTLFYMCAQSAARHNTQCRALYERLIAAGKQKKVALIAVANKLVKQVFAVVKSQRLFDNHYHEKSLAT